MGKISRDPVGPFLVNVRFSDGSTLNVKVGVDEATALNSYHEHAQGIGARVGTTKQVTLVCVGDDKSTEDCLVWKYKHTGEF